MKLDPSDYDSLEVYDQRPAEKRGISGRMNRVRTPFMDEQSPGVVPFTPAQETMWYLQELFKRAIEARTGKPYIPRNPF